MIYNAKTNLLILGEELCIFGVPLEVAVERQRCHDGVPLPMVRFHELMCGSCHFDRESNDKFNVECLLWFFQSTWKSDLKVVQITKNDLFWVNAPLSYLEWAPNCKTLPQTLKQIFDIQHKFQHLTPSPNNMNQTQIHKKTLILFWSVFEICKGQ